MIDIKKHFTTMKNGGINVLVDTASTFLVAAFIYSLLLGLSVLYASAYNTHGFPAPDSFSAASPQIATAISLFYASLQTKKYKRSLKQEQTP